MAASEFRFDPGQILQPLYPSPLNRTAPVQFGASLNWTRGTAFARKTTDGKFYPLNTAATDGTQTFAGFAQYSASTDASGNVYLAYGTGTPGANFWTPPNLYNALYTGGIFDPNDLQTSGTVGALTAEVDTITPTSPTTGDIYTVEAPNGVAASFTVGATQTATATVTGLTAAWNANPYLKSLATPSGTATLILTAKTGGRAMGLTASAVGTGTTALVITTPAVSGVQAQVDTFTPGGSITTGDVYTLTATLGGATTQAVSFTVGATATAAAVSAGLIAAWNTNATTAAIAVASGTSTVVLTSAVPGNIMSIAGSVVGVGTVSKASTTPAGGRSIADILPGCPGARVLAESGAWEVP